MRGFFSFVFIWNIITTNGRMNMLFFGLLPIILHLVSTQGKSISRDDRKEIGHLDLCNNVNCGSGVCLITQNPTLPYFCRCPSGANTILPCPTESLFFRRNEYSYWTLVDYLDPCSRNPCGTGICEVVPSLLHGYLCRCAGDTISLTSCNGKQQFPSLAMNFEAFVFRSIV